MRTSVDLLRHALDIVLCTLVLRILMGWLLAYPRLLNLIYSALIFGFFAAIVVWCKLPFAILLTIPLLFLIGIALFLSFLPELTRIYQSASRGNLFRPRTFQSEEIVKEMAQALWDLAKLRRGALFVFPRQFEVESLVSGGEDVEVRLNRSMILSIFNTYAPRHDGAVIVRQGKIVRVGAVLPLATAEGADVELGTRHLAAIGLTQRCDAAVLVVSEQRGVVSYVHQGNIQPLIANSVDEMEDRLLGLLGVKFQNENRRRHRLISGAMWAVALVLAIIGSYATERYYRSSLQDTKSVGATASVEFINVPSNMYISNMPTKPVNMDLRIPQKADIAGRNLNIQLDLSRAVPGVADFTLSDNMVKNLPDGSVVDRFEPAVIRVRLENPRTMDLAVQSPSVRGLRPFLRVTEIRLIPETVKVVVRDSSWKPGGILQVFPVDLLGINKAGNYERQVKLNLPPSIQLANGDPNTSVRVVIQVESK
ncbi:MAG: diadenylate cyclase [Verrucomicrobiales bacterium]|jgi:DNA integrity scanning protein DisA with diadenylate cyclase activity|nr:diadenylate cyclase [Verrucomicrobiales bacterium]